MKKLLQLSIFLYSIVSFGQAPVVNNPILNLAADNTLTISCAITPNGTVSSYEVIYSEDAFFTPMVKVADENGTVATQKLIKN